MLEEDKFVYWATLESVFHADARCSDETIRREFDFFDQPEWPLTSWKIFVGDEDHIVDAKVVLDVTPLLTQLQFGDVFAHEPAEEVVGDRLDDLPSAADVVGLGV